MQSNKQQSKSMSIPLSSTKQKKSNRPSSVLFQRIIIRLKVHHAIQHWKKLSKNSLNRYRRIQQWVKTQKDYIDDLKLIVQKIEKPLRQKQLITQQQQRIIFPNLSGIIMLSSQMYSIMKQMLQKWNPLKTQIAPAVIKLSSFFKIYIEYFNNYLKGKQILDSIKNKNQVKQIQKTLRMDFDSYLSKPTQRPVKYKLLLTDYQKKLRKDHPDYNALTKAIKVYHEVVQKTNQALQNQKKTRRMIQIQKIFKNILHSSRQWKQQFQAEFQNQNQIRLCNVQIFTDLILVISRGTRKQQLLAKIFLDGNSFVQVPEDNDQKTKRLFVVGKQQNGYFIFNSQNQQRNKIFYLISGLINSLHVNQWKRKQALSKVQSRRFSSLRFSKPSFNQFEYSIFHDFKKIKKNFRVTVIGVQQRTINQAKYLHYAIKIQLPFPDVINQKSLIRFQSLMGLEQTLRRLYPKINFRSINQIPKQLYKIDDILQRENRIIQYRMYRCQSFLNYVLRLKQTNNSVNLILYTIKMFQSMFQYVIDDKNQCVICDICQNGQIISNFQAYKHEQLSRINKQIQTKQQNFCVYRTFHVQNRLASLLKKNVRLTNQQILMYINCKLGIINPSLMNRIIQGDPIKIKTFLFNYQQFINKKYFQDDKNYLIVSIYQKDTVGQTLEQIRKLMKLESIKDFGLVVKTQQDQFLLTEDQLIYDVINQYKVSIQLDTNIKKNSFRGFFSKIKQSLQQKISTLKNTVHLYLKKIFVFPTQVQILSCANDPIRRNLICQQIFYRFKNKNLNISLQLIVKLSAFFICMYKIVKNTYLRRQQHKQILQQLFPSKRRYIINHDFLNQVHKIVKIYQNNKITKIDYFQNQLIQLINEIQGWSTFYVPITQLIKPQNILVTSGQGQLILGISWEYLSIRRFSSVQTVKISIDKLKLRYVGFMVVILEEEREIKLLCDNIFTFKYVLEKYQAYNKYFLGKDKVYGRPIMEETI